MIIGGRIYRQTKECLDLNYSWPVVHSGSCKRIWRKIRDTVSCVWPGTSIQASIVSWFVLSPFANTWWLSSLFVIVTIKLIDLKTQNRTNCWLLFTMTSSNGNIFRFTGHLCGDSPVPGEFPAQRPETRSFDAFFDLRLNKRLSKQSWGWWVETLSRPLWRHCNGWG